MVSCDSPEGYSVDYPAGWETNSGEVLPECSRFDPEPFEVPEATDERVAAIGVRVESVPFAQVASFDEDRNADRAVTTIDGLQAVRLQYEATGDGLWPEGTPIAMYAVDLGEERTLILDTVGVGDFDFEENAETLDRMARTVRIDMEGVAEAPNVVAAYGGGGGAFSVEARVVDSEACLRIPPDGDEVCTDLPAPDQLHTVQLESLEPVLAGVVGEEVWAVTAHLRDGTTSTVLPAPIGMSGAAGFALTVGLGEIDRFVLTDIEGNELRTVDPGG